MLGEDSIKNTHANLFTDIQSLIQKLNNLTLIGLTQRAKEV